MTPVKKDFVAYVGTVFGPYILVFNQTKAANLGHPTVNVGADKFLLTAHGLVNNDQVRFTSTIELPTPLSPDTYYYVVAALTDEFRLSLTPGGDVVNITDVGSGVLTVYRRGTPLDITGWEIRCWAKHVEDWDNSIWVDLGPTIIDGANGRAQILVGHAITQTWKYGDHWMSVLLKNLSNDWLGPYLIGKLNVRHASTDSGTGPPAPT